MTENELVRRCPGDVVTPWSKDFLRLDICVLYSVSALKDEEKSEVALMFYGIPGMLFLKSFSTVESNLGLP